MLSAVLLFVTKVLVLDLYLIEKVLDVLDVFQVLWLFVLVLANMKNTCTWLKYFEKYLTPTLLGAIRQQAITWAKVDQDPSQHMASLGHNELAQCLNQNGHHLAHSIFKCLFLNENMCILIAISLNFAGRVNKSALV